MKTKKFSKKMKLNKSTIANLYTEKMGKIKGGMDETQYSLLHECDGTMCDCGDETYCCTNDCNSYFC